MATQRVLAAMVVLVGVVALGAAAAGMDDPQRANPSEVVGEGPGDGPGRSGTGDAPGGEQGVMAAVPGWFAEWFMIVAAGLFSVIGAIVMAYIVWTDRLDGLLFLLGQVRDVALGVGALAVFLVVIIWFGFDFSTFTGTPEVAQPDPGGGGQPQQDQATGTGLPPVVVAVGVVLVAAAAIVAVHRLRRSDDEDEPAEAQLDLDVDEGAGEPSTPPASAKGLVEQAPDNPVYRAWYDLATTVGLAHERNRTPGEIAEAAVQQGLPSDAVATLTNVFSEVRYGHRPVTDERERRAKSALQSIDGPGREA